MTFPPVALKHGVSTRIEGRVHIDTNWQPVGVTEQFLESAETYHARYYNNGYWKYLVDRGLESARVDRSASLRVLDVGSGSGNSVFAAADLLPNSTILASDISPQLLRILVGIQENVPTLNSRIEAYCFDLHKDFFAEDTFDLVVGGAILHHMLDRKPLKKCSAMAAAGRKNSHVRAAGNRRAHHGGDLPQSDRRIGVGVRLGTAASGVLQGDVPGL